MIRHTFPNVLDVPHHEIPDNQLAGCVIKHWYISTSQSDLLSNAYLVVPSLEERMLGKNGKSLRMMSQSKKDGCNKHDMALDIKTAIMMGIMCPMWPVISQTTTAMEIEWVTPAVNAAAPTSA